MSAPNQYLVSFTDVSATVGGVDISSIVELHLTAAANDIPQLTLLVDAGHSEAGKPQTVEPVSLDNARQIFETCRGMVKTAGATLSLSLTCTAVGPGGPDSQTLSISDWLLTDVALSPIQIGGVCTVALTFMHPLCKAHFGGAIPGLVDEPPVLEGVTQGNPLEVFVAACRAYAELHRMQPLPVSIPGASDAATVRKRLLSHLENATASLEASLSWTEGGLPAQTQLAGWDEYLCLGISAYALPSGGNSVFQSFAKCLVPECSLAIGGDYTQGKLDVGPFAPWAEPSLTIKDSDIVSLEFPQRDPSPLSGVKVNAVATEGESLTSFNLLSSQTGDGGKPSETYYVPDSELAAEFLYGPIQQFNEPGWLSHMSYYAKHCSSPGESDVGAASSGNHLQLATSQDWASGSPLSGGAGGDSPAVDYGEALLACAKAYYETSLMKDWAFTVNTRLLFASGGTLCPGKVLAVTANSGEVLAGYVAAVTHSISVSSRSAKTTLVCTHPRLGAKPDSITSASNALYT